ncbi:hypothetical protein K440DRAFT_212956 [Wilcoxina mikolae CBS 423.85]|nr:hypothetical protein K440DRAFT_212956 [Wilcoxina mikolae CBS 423.85]
MVGIHKLAIHAANSDACGQYWDGTYIIPILCQEPLVAAWARRIQNHPYSHLQYSGFHDDMYLAMENGRGRKPTKIVRSGSRYFLLCLRPSPSSHPPTQNPIISESTLGTSSSPYS